MSDTAPEEVRGHCFRCRARKTMLLPTESRLKNGRMAVSGACVTCGTAIFRLVAAPENREPARETGGFSVPENKGP